MGWEDARAGAAAGVAATGLSMLMVTVRRTGWTRGQAARAAVGHLAIGAACGALYEVARKRVPVRTPPVVAGVALGLGVWLLGHKGWVPALRILPPPQRDRAGRPTSTIVAHVVYGATVGGLLRRR